MRSIFGIRHNNKTTMKAIQGDITTLTTDAIVNAANSSLLGGGGVDGAIHNAAGLDLLHECRLHGGCKTGDAKLTKGYDLHAKYIIHTVGPVWNKGKGKQRELLASCYNKCLEIAENHPEIQSIAFPCISTGIYAFPMDLAVPIAIEACENSELDITFCCYTKASLDHYLRYL